MKTLAIFAFSKFNSKHALIYFNRLLAWCLLISPALQIILDTGFWKSMAFDLALLLVHGVLSLILFDKTFTTSARAQTKTTGSLDEKLNLHVKRNISLADARRILICLLAPPLLFITVLPLGFPLAMLFFPVIFIICYFILLLISLPHVRNASSHAFRRWRLPRSDAMWLGLWTTCVFAALTAINFFGGLWLWIR